MNTENREIFEGIEQVRIKYQLDEKSFEALKRFATLQFIESLQEFAKDHTLFELIKKIIVDACLSEYYERVNKSYKKRKKALRNLNELPTIAQDFIADKIDENTKDKLLAFLSCVDQFSAEDQDSEKDDAVHLMTVHKSKGLEFDVVFVVGLENGVFPDSREKIPGEERRTFYVAVTRAKKYLYLSYSRNRNWRTNRVSSFLKEIKNKTWEDLDLMELLATPQVEKETESTAPQIEIKKEEITTPTKKESRSDDSQIKIGRDYYNNVLYLNDIVEHRDFGRGKIVEFSKSPITLKILFDSGETIITDLGNKKLYKVSC